MTSAQSAHNLQKFDKNSDTLMTINSKTRPICPDKKFLSHLCQKKKMPLQEYPIKYADEG